MPAGIPFMGRDAHLYCDMMRWKDWVHVTKLDPDKQLKPGDIDAIASSGTDALMLSGTLNVTQENLSALQKQVKAYNLPLVMEPAGPEAVLMQGIDYVFVPSVMNTTDVQWIVGKHRAWVQQHNGRIPWDSIVPEAYIVLNPNSSVGKVTKAICELSAAEVAAYTTIADRYFHFPIVYLEYSGMFGDPDVVKAASEAIDTSVLYYGGGINSAEKAARMSKYADTIVVGNAVYDQGASVLKDTVDAAQ
jgi:phosphoglycerol geranylgeranyltransferase